ncbi:MAG TPA: hypothetical protein DHV51_03770 [Opitutae bacterium]|nr:hypothetical protein [Opitutae bacterium]
MQIDPKSVNVGEALKSLVDEAKKQIGQEAGKIALNTIQEGAQRAGQTRWLQPTPLDGRATIFFKSLANVVLSVATLGIWNLVNNWLHQHGIDVPPPALPPAENQPADTSRIVEIDEEPLSSTHLDPIEERSVPEEQPKKPADEEKPVADKNSNETPREPQKELDQPVFKPKWFRESEQPILVREKLELLPQPTSTNKEVPPQPVPTMKAPSFGKQPPSGLDKKFLPEEAKTEDRNKLLESIRARGQIGAVSENKVETTQESVEEHIEERKEHTNKKDLLAGIVGFDKGKLKPADDRKLAEKQKNEGDNLLKDVLNKRQNAFASSEDPFEDEDVKEKVNTKTPPIAVKSSNEKPETVGSVDILKALTEKAKTMNLDEVEEKTDKGVDDDEWK